MNRPLAQAAVDLARARQTLECARALIFDVDGPEISECLH
jgi:hypothetical protein